MKPEMEMLLWDYVDGRCTADEASYVREMLEKDEQWRTSYESLVSFNQNLHGIETEQPSLRFTKNVMDAVAQVTPIRTVQKNWVVWGLCFFFVAAIAIGLIWALASGSTTSSARFSLPDWSITNRGIQAFLLGDVVVILLLMDQLLRRRRAKSA